MLRRRTGSLEPISPIYTPQVNTPLGLIGGLREILLYSDTHMLELLLGIYVLTIRPYYRLGLDTIVCIVCGLLVFLFQLYALGRQSITLREHASTWSLVFMSVHLYFESMIKGGIGFHSYTACAVLIYVKWRLMRERVYRQVETLRAERRTSKGARHV